MGDRAAVYCRLSWAPDGSLEKVDRQEEDCHALAKRIAWNIDQRHIYQDNNASAWKRNRKRPGWDAMLAAVEAGEVDSIIVYHGDRLVRQPWDLEHLLRLSDERHVELASVSGIRNLGSADDRFILRIEVAQACKASDDTSRRVKRGWRARAEKGLPVGGGKRPFGFEPGGLTHRPAEAEVLADAASRLLAGQGVSGVVRWLNEVSTTSQGKRWAPRTLKNLLLSPRVAGLIVSQGKTYQAAWEGIISVEDQEEIRSLYAANSAMQPEQDWQRKYLLSGVAECSFCGGAMITKPSGGRNRKTSRIYYCPDCRKLGRNQEHLDQYVTSAVLRLLNRPKFMAGLTADTDPRLGQEIAQLERRRTAAKVQLEALVDHPDIDAAMVARSLSSFSDRIAELRSQQAATTRGRLLARVAGIDRAAWDELPVDIRSAVVRALYRVVVLPATWRGPGFDTKSVRLKRRPIARRG